MAKEAPSSPIKAKTSAFLNRLKRVKSDHLGPSELAQGSTPEDAIPGTLPVQVGDGAIDDLQRRAATVILSEEDEPALALDRATYNAEGLSAVTISTSPFLPSPSVFGEAPATPLSSATGSLPVDPASDATLNPADISLPLPSPTEDEALSLSDVSELQAFVEKELWIQRQIDILRGLESVDCFASCRSTFADNQAESATALPSTEAVEAMFAQHEEIEAEVEKLDNGELARLRHMAKAASIKSLSCTDTDLLEITFSTLFLLDTLLHLLRDRGDKLDLLALRLNWDARRAGIALDISAYERDVTLFIEQRGRWSFETYRQASGAPPVPDESDAGGVGRFRGRRRGSDASIQSVSSTRSFGPGSGMASRSQRFLMTQIMEFDCQSFKNRIYSLRNGPVAQAEQTLDRMIDLAASIRARSRRRAAHEQSLAEVADDPAAADAAPQIVVSASESLPTGETDNGALPDWFLDEMDGIELKVDRLQAWDDLARAHARQWRNADHVFHTLRRAQIDAETLVTEIAQAALQQPTAERASGFDSKLAQHVSAVALARETLSDQSALVIPPALFAATSTALSVPADAVLEFLAAELQTTQHAIEVAKEKVDGYRQLADRISALERLRSIMVDLVHELSDSVDSLSSGQTVNGSNEAINLSTIACLQFELQADFLYRLDVLSTTIPAAVDRSKSLLKQASMLLMAVKASGMDPNLRSAIQATSSRLQDLALTADTALVNAQRDVKCLEAYQSISSGQDGISATASRLHSSLLASLDREQWRGQSPPPTDASLDPDWSLELATLTDELDMRVSQSLSSLDDAARMSHLAVVGHLTDRMHRQRLAVSALTELALHFLPLIRKQRQVVELLSVEAAQLRRACASAAAGPPSSATRSEVTRLESEIEAFLAAIPRDIPLVSSPAFAAALTVTMQSPTSDEDRTATTLDPERLDDTVRAHLNALAAEVINKRELLRDRSRVAFFDTAVEAVDTELSAVLESIDAVRDQPQDIDQSVAHRDGLDGSLRRLSSALGSLVSASVSLPDQARAQAEVSRLQRAADEMAEMAVTVLHPSQACSRSTSVASSLASEASSAELDDGGQTSFLSDTTASNGQHAKPAATSFSPSSASIASSTAAIVRPGSSATSNSKTPTRVPVRAVPGRVGLPTSLVPAWAQSSRSVSGPARDALPESQPSRLLADPSHGLHRPRAVSSTGMDGHIATPSRVRSSSQPSVFLSPAAIGSSTARSSSSALPRSLQYSSPSGFSAIGAIGPQASPSGRRIRSRANGEASHIGARVETPDEPELATPIRRRSSTTTRALRTSLPRRPYVPQKGHKLDRAVSKIVNAMPMEIPIVAAHEGSDAEAGRYWIGQPPKLCYCRILRSRTVMVRVGGGWVELSKFLTDHFKDMIPTSSPSTVLSPADPGTAERWLSGGNGGGLATPSRAPGSRVVSQPLAPNHLPIVDSPAAPLMDGNGLPLTTPDREDHSMRRVRKVSTGPATPTFKSPRTMTLLVSSPGPDSPRQPAGPSSPASPIIPLQLMRKAGDGERSNPSSLSVAGGIGLGLPSSSHAARATARTTSNTSSSGSRNRPSIPWRF